MLFSARFWQELSRQKFFWKWFSKLKKKCFKEFERIFATGFVRKGPFLPHQHAWNHSGQRSLLQANEKSLFCLEGKFSKNFYFIVDELLTACFHEKVKTNFEFPRSFRPMHRDENKFLCFLWYWICWLKQFDLLKNL